MSFKLMTENTTDLPVEYLDAHEIGVFTLPAQVDGKTYDDYRTIDSKMFFENMRKGSMPTTSQVNPEVAREGLLREIEQHKEILVIAFSSGLSGTYSSISVAAEEIMEEHKDVKIIVIDSLCASMGEGLLLHKTIAYKDAGHTLEETAAYVESIKMNVVHLFTVDDLFHLYRGGRVSKTTAVIGSLANIKPILHVDCEGHLINISKTRGRKKSLSTLVEMMGEKMGSFADKNDIFMISHGDCEEDAVFLADMIKKRFGIEQVLINCLGATIGAHTGPGLIALFFMGDER
ncbi:MAG: DegV family protein [Lachnospiraceae bacterium]|nr:DegV family protein [Lachnospiraceae bacterium]